MLGIAGFIANLALSLAYFLNDVTRTYDKILVAIIVVFFFFAIIEVTWTYTVYTHYKAFLKGQLIKE